MEADGFVTFNLTTDITMTLVPKEYMYKLTNCQIYFICQDLGFSPALTRPGNKKEKTHEC